MDALSALTLALGASWASGINLYATALLLGLANLFGIVDLPPDLQVLSSPMVLMAAAGLYFVEFIADKIPGVDSLWDILHTFVRIPAGAALAAGSMGGWDAAMSGDLETIAALVAGGTVSAGTHATKAGTRALINTSPEPFSNWVASVTEDLLVIVGVVMALFNPVVFLVVVGLFALLVIWLVPKIWRGLKRLFGGARHPVEQMRETRAGVHAARAGDAGPRSSFEAEKKVESAMPTLRLPPE